jgi:hypothetical protein
MIASTNDVDDLIIGHKSFVSQPGRKNKNMIGHRLLSMVVRFLYSGAYWIIQWCPNGGFSSRNFSNAMM